MKHLLCILTFACCLLFAQVAIAGGPTTPDPPQKTMISGISITSPRNKVGPEVMNSIVNINANWVTLLPFGYCQKGKPKVSYSTDIHWWGEKLEGTAKMTQYAKARGMKVMIKPQVWIPESWPGELAMGNEEDWQEWESQYQDMILAYARLGETEGVDMLCIGTEHKAAIQQRPEFWSQLIAEVRKVYSGELTYAANWDSFHLVPFWSELDYIGIDAYFPLTSEETPTVPVLKRKWKDPKIAIKLVQRKHQKPVLFTEYGYKSIQQTAWRQWEFENTPDDQNVNLVAQENAYQAIFEMFWDEPWFAGGFIWKWYVHEKHPGGHKNSDYTPQNKPVEKMIRKVYGGESQ